MCKNICDPSKNVHNMLTGSRIDEGGNNIISSLPYYKNPYFQNLPPFKMPFNDFQTLNSVVQPTTDVSDNLVPMLSKDGNINFDREKFFVKNAETNHPIIVKESLPAPINQYARDRIFQENNLQPPLFGQWTDGRRTTINGNPITPVPSATLEFKWDYDDSRNYLATNQVNEKNRAKVNILIKPASDSCGNSCSEPSNYSHNFPGMKTETSSSMEYEELEKSEQEDKKDYYDEIIHERNAPTTFSSHSSLKKNIILKKFCDLCNNNDIQKTTSLDHEIRQKLASFATKNNLQNDSVVKSKSELHSAANNNFKQLSKANNNNPRMNFSSTAVGNRKSQNSKKLQHQEHSKVIGSFEEHKFRLPNYNLLQTNRLTKEPKGTGQPNIPISPSLKFRKRLSNESTKFLINSTKPMKTQVPKNKSNRQLNTLTSMKKSPKYDSLSIKNATMKSAGQQTNVPDQVDHQTSKLQRKVVKNTIKKTTNGLKFSNVRKKPELKKVIVDRSLHYIKKPDMRDKYRNTLILKMQRDIWTNISGTSRKHSLRRKRLKKIPDVLITPIPIENTILNPPIEHRISIKKTELKRPIRTRKAKLFYSDVIK